MVKYDYGKEYKKGDNMTILWYSLKNLDPYLNIVCPIQCYYVNLLKLLQKYLRCAIDSF
jgi:hypothetical protein